MVNFQLILGSYLVPLIVNLLVTVAFVSFAYRKRIYPLLMEVEEAKAEAEAAIKKGMSAMGTASGLVRTGAVAQEEFEELEAALLENVLESKFPELNMLLSQIAPDMAEQIKDNPAQFVQLYEKYEPLLIRFGMLKGSQEEQQPSYMYG